MQFVRKKQRGQDKKVQRTWFSEEGYRIVWRKEVHGIQVPARYQACVRVLVPGDIEPRQMWDFVNHKRRLIKTLQAAQEECEKHCHLWTKVIEAGGIRALRELFDGKLPSGLPLWARKNIDRRLYAILMDNRALKYREEDDESCSNPDDVTETLPTSASPADVPLAIPILASPATETAVPPVEAAAKAPAKPAGKRTRKSSKRTGKRKRTTTGSSASEAKHSRGSRKRKSKQSANSECEMAKPRAQQTNNKVSMEEATTLGGRRNALAARRSKTELAALREDLQAQAKTKGSRAKIADALKKEGAKGKDKIPKTALRLINPTYRGMDVIPEGLNAQRGPR